MLLVVLLVALLVALFEGAASLNPSVADLSVVDSLVDSLGLAYPLS